jgi:hypothetical protein
MCVVIYHAVHNVGNLLVVVPVIVLTRVSHWIKFEHSVNK